MKHPARLALLIATLAAPAAAQEATALRAGDQDGLSRIVIDLPPGTEWVLRQDVRQVMLRFPGTALEIDTSAIFPGRAVSRVLTAQARAEATGTVLALTLACDCAASARPLGARTLILDVTDEPPELAEAPASSLAEIPPPRRPRPAAPAATAPDPGPAETPLPAPAAEDVRTATAQEAPAPAHEVVGEHPADPGRLRVEPHDAPHTPPPGVEAAEARPPAPLPQPVPEAVETPAEPDPPPAREGLDQTEAAEIEQARKALLDKLSRAAEQGLVDLAVPGALPLPEQADPDPHHDEETPPAHEDIPEPAGPGISVQTARDRDRRPEAVAPERQVDPACLAAAEFDLAGWAGTGPPAAQIAAARTALVGEFDRVSQEALDRLARIYLHLGFGAEAGGLMAAFPAPPGHGTERALLADLARVIEARAPLPGGPLLKQSGCPGAAGLWGFLARLDPLTAAPSPRIGPIDPDAMRDAFGALPPGLRRLVGPRLVRGVLRLGDTGLARDLLARIRRAPGSYGDDYYLAEAALMAAEGDAEAAETIWRALIARNRPNAAEAMIALTESRLARGLPPPEGLTGDLSTQAYEQRHSQEGVRLRQAEIEARAAAGALDTALAMIAQDLADDPARAPALRALAARVLARSDAETTGPARYAAALLAHGDLLSEEAPADPARLVVAGELTGIGLPNTALGFLAPALKRGADPARLAAATAHLALNRPQTALELTATVKGREAGLIRAAALARAGAYAAALEALPEDAPETLRARYAFAAGEWDRARSVDNPVDRLLAAYMAGTQSPAAAETDPLAPGTTESSFLTRPELDGPITLEAARQAADLARSARELLTGRLSPGG